VYEQELKKFLSKMLKNIEVSSILGMQTNFPIISIEYDENKVRDLIMYYKRYFKNEIEQRLDCSLKIEDKCIFEIKAEESRMYVLPSIIRVSSKDIHKMLCYISQIFNWSRVRLLWFGEKNQTSVLSRLAKEIIRTIISFLVYK